MPEDLVTTTCPFCKEEIKVGAIKCKHCGTELDSVAIHNQKSAKKLKEKDIFNKYDVKITNKRVLVDNKTFALKNITSVSSHFYSDSWKWWPLLGAIVLGYIGFAWIDGVSDKLWALIPATFFFFASTPDQDEHYVEIVTAAGETYYVLGEVEESVRSEVIAALNDAIVSA